MWNPFKRRENDLDKEIQFHLDQQIRDYMDDGLSEAEARRRATMTFGGPRQVKESCREVGTTQRLATFLGNCRYSARSLARNPGFTTVAILSLALGLGANTAVFQIIDAVGLRSLPVASPGELHEIHIDGGTQGFGLNRLYGELTYPLWEQIRADHEPFTGVFAWSPGQLTVGEDDQIQVVRAAWFSGEAFAVLGVVPHRGRLLAESDDVPGCSNNVVISHRLWQSHFGGSDDAVGSGLVVRGERFAVIGVVPPEFFGVEVGNRFDIALPFCTLGNWDPDRLQARNQFWLRAFGRLHPDWSTSRAALWIATSSVAWFEGVAPDNYTATLMGLWDSFRMTATPRPNGVSLLRTNYSTALWLLLGITGLVFAIACLNLANLTLARTLDRSQEIATRLAIGGSRRQVIAAMLTESLLLTSAGAIVGAVLAGTLSGALLRFLNTQGTTAELDVGMSWMVTVTLTATALAGGLFFGLSTAFYATGDRTIARAVISDRGSTGDRRRFSLQSTLVAGQVGVSLVLVVASFLFLESFRYLVTMDAGFAQDGVVFTYINRPPTTGQRPVTSDMLDAVRAIPGVESATTSSHRPLNGGRTTLVVRDPDTGEESDPHFTWVSPGYFDTMEIPFLTGRDFTDRDGAEAPRVLLVNARFARDYFDGEDPVGQTVRSLEEPGYPETVYQVVGVVADTRYASLREGIRPIAYAPDAQEPSGQSRPAIVTRSTLPAAAIGSAIRSAVSANSPNATVGEVVDLRQEVLLGLARERLLAWLGGFFGFLALTLAGIGLYGVVSYMVSNRRREIGIRMALGAGRRAILAMILGQTARMAVLGCLTGIVLAIAVLRLARSLLFGVTPTNPAAIGAGVLVLLGVALAAAYLPGRRAAQTNPVETLRNG